MFRSVLRNRQRKIDVMRLRIVQWKERMMRIRITNYSAGRRVKCHDVSNNRSGGSKFGQSDVILLTCANLVGP